MESIFNVTRHFEKDLRKLGESDRRKVETSISQTFHEFGNRANGFSRKVYRPRIVHLDKGLESSLYCLRVDPSLRVILTVDEDPVFGQVIITLMRAVGHKDLMKAFDSIAESLYQREFASANGDR